jgi:5'-methylthioadenosine phosphorylase
MARVGIIGGSGLDDPDLFKRSKELDMETPFGKPTSPLSMGNIGSNEVVLVSRHGRGHQFSPTEVNFRANIWALKETGVSHIVATTACGSLKEEIRRGDFIVVDQFIDFTRDRKTTFFESFKDGAHHTAMADPFDPDLRKILFETSQELGFKTHWGGTVVTIEGPRFSTRAESRMFRIWGGDVINMSVASEAMLANEVKIPYAAVAMSTDYDCWKEDEEPVSWEEIVRVFHQNAQQVTTLLIHAINKIK